MYSFGKNEHGLNIRFSDTHQDVEPAEQVNLSFSFLYFNPDAF